MTGEQSAGPGEIRVVAGNPTDEELAALVGVLYAARSRAIEPPVTQTPARWITSARPNIRLRAGAGAWRASAQPR